MLLLLLLLLVVVVVVVTISAPISLPGSLHWTQWTALIHSTCFLRAAQCHARQVLQLRRLSGPAFRAQGHH